MDYVRILGLEVDCIVGIRPRERRRRQSVRVDLELGLDLSVAARSGRIAQTVDYARVTDEVSSLLRFREYRLIEMATEELCAMLLGIHPMLESVRIRIEKPAALQGRARSASVEMERNRQELPRREHMEAFGTRELLLETNEASLTLLHLDRGCELLPATEVDKRQVDWLVSGELTLNDAALRICEPLVWPHGRGEVYHNPSKEPAVLFSCVCPVSKEPAEDMASSTD